MDTVRYIRKIGDYSALVMFSHSIFSASFAIAAAFFAAGMNRVPVTGAGDGGSSLGISRLPGFYQFFWIMTAFIGARTFANALNRIIDRKIDAENSRTASRHIPTGAVSLFEASAVAFVFFALFILGASMLPSICLRLVPFAGIMMVLYSYAKRFTWLCHFFLGAVCSFASFGGWLGITGAFQWQMLPLALANGAWVTGFDIIYSVQDMDHDRKAGLYSVPARFGRKAAFAAAVFLHLFSFAALVIQGAVMNSGIIYFAGVAVIGVLFVFQHAHTLRTAFGNVNFASYNVNRFVGIVLIFAAAGDAFHRFLL